MTTVVNLRPRNAGRGRPSKGTGVDLKAVILDAAEALFAHHGFYGVTTRQVAKEAGVDTALIHYYFGTKRELFDAVLLRRAEVINQDRADAMTAYEAAHPGTMTAEGVIAAFIDPLIERTLTGGQGWKNWLALVSQIAMTRDWGGEIMHRFFDPVVHQLIDTLQRAMPGSQLPDLYWCYQFLTGSMMMTVAETGRIDQLSDGLCHSSDLEAARQRLYTYCAAGFEAVVKTARP